MSWRGRAHIAAELQHRKLQPHCRNSPRSGYFNRERSYSLYLTLHQVLNKVRGTGVQERILPYCASTFARDIKPHDLCVLAPPTIRSITKISRLRDAEHIGIEP